MKLVVVSNPTNIPTAIFCFNVQPDTWKLFKVMFLRVEM
jgi:hypothetical protein